MATILNFRTAMCFPVRLVLASTLLFFALQSNASPATPRNLESLVTFNSSLNAVINHCYTPGGRDTPGIKPVQLEACKQALTVLVHQAKFSEHFRFSRNPRASAIEVPTGWQMGAVADCRIIVNCENDRDSAVFRYADIARVAKSIIDNCVDQPDPFGRYPLFRWGGIARLNQLETFYVAVAKPLPPTLEIVGANGTVGGSEGLIYKSIDSL